MKPRLSELAARGVACGLGSGEPRLDSFDVTPRGRELPLSLRVRSLGLGELGFEARLARTLPAQLILEVAHPSRETGDLLLRRGQLAANSGEPLT